jgi:hypothetical protein
MDLPFPDPIGVSRCLEFGRGEEGWFSDLPRQYTCTSWVCFRPALMNGIVQLLNASGSLRLMKAFGAWRRRIPSELSREEKVVMLSVLSRGTRRAACTLERDGDYGLTVASTVLIVKRLLRLKLSDPRLAGVHRMHRLFGFHDFRADCESVGMRFTEIEPAG